MINSNSIAKEATDFTYPKIRVYRNGFGEITMHVLFTSPNDGVVLAAKEGSPYDVGYIGSSFDPDYFEDFDGVLELSNV